MATGMSLASERKRAGKIRALVIDQDLLICLDPCRFSMKKMARLECTAGAIGSFPAIAVCCCLTARMLKP